jgi:hypothetical protein
MKHCSEEELIDYYYREGGQACALHLDTCADCAESYAELRNVLAAVPTIEPPPRNEAYGKRVWGSLAGHLPARPRRTLWLGLGLWRGLAYAAICLLIVAGAFFAGRVWEHRKPPVAAAHAPAPARPRVVIVLLGDHLDRTERLLVALKHADASNTEMISPLRDEARSLLEANRVCLQNTDEEDDPALAETLDHLDGLLSEIVNQPGGLTPETIARLQKEMRTEGLLFEVRVLRSKIADRKTVEHARSQEGSI